MRGRSKQIGALIGVMVGLAWIVLRHNNMDNIVISDNRPFEQDGPKVMSKGATSTREFGRSPKVQSLSLLMEAWRRIGKYDNSFEAVDAVSDSGEKDYLLSFFANRLLTEYSTDKHTNESYILENGGEAKVREVVIPFRKSVEMIKNASIKIPLLLRLHAVKGMLDRDKSDARDTEKIIATASLMAKNLPDDALNASAATPTNDNAIDWKSGLIFTCILGVIGYILASVSEPALKSFGVIVGMAIAKQLGQEEFLKIIKKYDASLIKHAIDEHNANNKT